MDKACDIYERHCVITQFLMQTLQLDMDAADADACRIEHVISQESFEKIRAHVREMNEHL